MQQAVEYIDNRIKELGKVYDYDLGLAISELLAVRFILELPQPSNVIDIGERHAN